MSSIQVTTNFRDSNGVDLGTKLVTKDYLISVYPEIGEQIGIPPELWTWGYGSNGRLGTNDTTDRSTPVTTFAGGTNWKQVECGTFHTAAIKTDGTLWTWGYGGNGQLGTNDVTDRSTPVTTFAGGTNWRQISAGRNYTAAIKTDGTLWTWGDGSDGQLGINNPPTINIPVTTFAGGTNWADTATTEPEDLYTLSAGNNHTVAIKTDGTLWTWGSGSDGRLGTNDTTIISTPVTTFAGGTNWKQISSGSRSTAAIKTDGTLWTWGRGFYGQLGTNDTTQRNTPVTTFAGGTNWKQVSVGYNFISAIKTDGTLWVWGAGVSGRLGTNDTTQRNTPVTTFAGGTNWKQVSAGVRYAAAIKTDGTLWTWGNNGSGQLGNVTVGGNVLTPVTTFAGGTDWKQVSAGMGSSVNFNALTAAIKTDGTLWTWGYGFSGQLGTNNTTNTSTPVTTFSGGTDWKQVSAGNGHTAAIKTDGTLWVWGVGISGQLGNAETFSRSTPVTTFAGGTNWKQVSAGQNYTVALRDDGINKEVFTWGARYDGLLGDNYAPNRSTPVTTFAGGTNWKQVSAGRQHTSAIKTDGTLWTWGYGRNGQLGNAVITPNLSDSVRFTPVTTFAGGTNWKQVSAGGHTAAIKTDGTLWTWGQGSNGQLGTNDAVNRSTPVTTFAGGTDWKQVSAGNNHTAAIKTDGTLWTWGYGGSGRLGNANTPQRSTPVTTFAGGTNWKQVSAGYNHTAAIKTDGTLWVWGQDETVKTITDTQYIKTSTSIDGICNATAQLTGTTSFLPIPSSGTRITTSSGDTGTVTSITNSLLGISSLTESLTPTSGSNDDGYWTVTLPFDISYNGTSYNTIYVGTNSYVTFNAGYNVYSSLSFSNPNDQKIMISSRDNSCQRFCFGTEGTAPNRTYRLRWEGNNSSNGTLNSPTIVWEMVFYENATNQIDIQVDLNSTFTLSTPTSVSTPITTFAGGTNWKQVSAGQNHTAAIKSVDF